MRECSRTESGAGLWDSVRSSSAHLHPSRAQCHPTRFPFGACRFVSDNTPLVQHHAACGGHSTGRTGGSGNPARRLAGVSRAAVLWQAAQVFDTTADFTADRARYDRATAHLDAPLAIVDLDAFDANADDLVRRAGGKPIRVASKSVRCRAPAGTGAGAGRLRGHHVASPSPSRCGWPARASTTSCSPIRPPTGPGFAELAGDPKLAAAVTVMVDDPAQLDADRRGARRRRREEIRVCLELDTSLRLLGGRVRVGARRSPLHAPAQLAELARSVARRPGFRLVGLMAYEGHVAGVGDAVAGRPLRSRGDPADAGRGPPGAGGAPGRGRARGAGASCRTWSSSTAAAPAACSTPRPRTR